MPRVANSSIETLKHQVDLVDVVSPYVQLKRAGGSWKGLSPFTQENTPSFYVHPDRGFYKCFSTGEGGDLFTFIMKVENLEFIEAVEFIAKKFNHSLEYEAGGPSREDVSLRKQLFELHDLATNWFHNQFLKSKEATPVRTYWTEKRGFSLENATEFKIGYAPTAIDSFALLCKEREISLAAMHRSGLFFAYENERDHRRFKSRFRGRLIIPIRDVQGRVVAFTARKLEQTPQNDPARDAKYINSPETPIFHKGRILFGLDHARTHLKDHNDHFILVEGQLDAIRCWTVGLHTAVAPQGTALTDEQVTLMRRYDPKQVECLLDGDSAGHKAALRYVPIALKAGLDFRFLLLPENADPDNLLRKHGADALHALRTEACDGIELAIAEYLPKDRKPSTHEKTTALRNVFDLLQYVNSEVAREDYIQAAARRLNVDPLAALRDYKLSRKNSTQKRSQDNAPSHNSSTKDALLTQATWELLWLIFHFPEYGLNVSQIINYEWINTNSQTGALLVRILAEFREGLVTDTKSMEQLMVSTQDRQILADINMRDLEVETPKEQIIACLKTLYRNHLINKKNSLEQKITNADSEGKEIELMQKVKNLRTKIAQPINIEL
ncbi:MAG: DNA primase [Verrucomicrobiota bacterium]|nr:DNA primase [Verrucomicrobiota bacterium]